MQLEKKTLAETAFPWLCAAAFWVTVTLTVGGQDIRISLADFALPLLALIALGAGGRWRTLVDRPGIHWTWLVWAAVTTGWLTVSLFIGRAALGEWSAWAVQNKYIGWFALLFFLAAGFALTRTIPGFASEFLTGFVVVGWIVSLATLLMFVATVWFAIPPVFFEGNDVRASGLLTNPNAFGFIIAIVAVLQLTGCVRLYGLAWLRILMLSAVLTVLMLSGSRAAWLAFVVAIVLALFVRGFDWRAFGPALVVGVTVVFAINTLYQNTVGQNIYAIERLERSAGLNVDDMSTSDRYVQFRHAVPMWLNSPVVGIGLGRYLADEQALGIQIHNTYLWLLVETGLPGLILVGGFFLTLFVRAGCAARTNTIAFIGTLVLIIFAVFALFHEALYQRYVWFIAGILIVHLAGDRRSLRSTQSEPEKIR